MARGKEFSRLDCTTSLCSSRSWPGREEEPNGVKKTPIKSYWHVETRKKRLGIFCIIIKSLTWKGCTTHRFRLAKPPAGSPPSPARAAFEDSRLYLECAKTKTRNVSPSSIRKKFLQLLWTRYPESVVAENQDFQIFQQTDIVRQHG